jgi:hypothetical protein
MAGMAGAIVGVGLYAAGLIGDVWPVVAVALYGVGALIAPGDPRGEPQLTDVLRSDAADLVARVEPRVAALPAGTVDAVRRIVEVVRLVLDRLDEVADQPADRAAAPDRLAVAAEIVRVDLPVCLDTYLSRAPSTAADRAAVELVTQLDLIAGAVDRLAAQVPDVHAQRAEDLTRELRRRHGEP